MSASERAGLIAKIRQIRGPSPSEPPPGGPLEGSARIQAIEARVAHLEELIEGLQDSVHRQFERESSRIADLETQIDPAAIAAALSRNARERGL